MENQQNIAETVAREARKAAECRPSMIRLTGHLRSTLATQILPGISTSSTVPSTTMTRVQSCSPAPSADRLFNYSVFIN